MVLLNKFLVPLIQLVVHRNKVISGFVLFSQILQVKLIVTSI